MVSARLVQQDRRQNRKGHWACQQRHTMRRQLWAPDTALRGAVMQVTQERPQEVIWRMY